VKAARRVVVGADKIARFLVALVQEAGPSMLAGARPVFVNGEVGLLVPADPAGPAPIVVVLTVDGDRARAVHAVMTPEKLSPATAPT
jgi:RNA polymerase sigma-70 factor (ECF subfamily)